MEGFSELWYNPHITHYHYIDLIRSYNIYIMVVGYMWVICGLYYFGQQNVGYTILVKKKYPKIKVLRMGWPIVENLSGVCGILFKLFRVPLLNFGEKSKNWSIFMNFPIFPYFSIWSVWGLSLGSCNYTPLCFHQPIAGPLVFWRRLGVQSLPAMAT